jgi:perosamine synthetase
MIRQNEILIDHEEITNIMAVLNNKWLSEGPFCKTFVKMVKDLTGAKYALLAPNGTLALYLCLTALDLKKGDEVIVPDFTFNATASAVVFAGGTPVFVDVHKSDLNIDVEEMEKAISDRTKAIIPVHIYGQSADMDTIKEIAELHFPKITIIEDVAESLGVFYKNWHTGTIGDMGFISFFSDKSVPIGEGGIILTDNEEYYTKLKYLRNQGREQSGGFVHDHLGMNFRITDLQGAVGVAQMHKFDANKKKKIENYQMYKKILGDSVTFLEEKAYSNLVCPYPSTKP